MRRTAHPSQWHGHRPCGAIAMGVHLIRRTRHIHRTHRMHRVCPCHRTQHRVVSHHQPHLCHGLGSHFHLIRPLYLRVHLDILDAAPSPPIFPSTPPLFQPQDHSHTSSGSSITRTCVLHHQHHRHRRYFPLARCCRPRPELLRGWHRHPRPYHPLGRRCRPRRRSGHHLNGRRCS